MLSNKQILEQAINKAIDGGWKAVGRFHNLDIMWWMAEEAYRAFIFNPHFAMSIWGTKPHYWKTGDYLNELPEWQYHLQQMVISPDPIAYLKEHI